MLPYRSVIFIFVVMLTVVTCATTASRDPYTQTISVFEQSPQVKPFFENAYGYAVFPTIGKGGFFIGGAYGKGQVYRQGAVTGSSEVVKLSAGFQLGGQAFSEIIFLQDKRAYDDFTAGNFEFDATASAVAVTAGAQAQAGSAGQTAGASTGPATGVQAPTAYRKGMAVFFHTKGGLMYEAALGGQKFTFNPY